MKGLMLTLALATLSVLYVLGDVPLQPNFQQDRMVGTWYDIGEASNSVEFQAEKHKMKMGTTVITATADNNLDVVTTFPKDDKCDEKTMTYIKTDEPGRFLLKDPLFGSDHVITVVDTDYDQYSLMFSLEIKGSTVNKNVSLFGRSTEARPEIVEKFKNLAKGNGLTDDNILLLPQSETCMPEP